MNTFPFVKEVANLLMDQVANAVPDGGSERDVVTVVSGPMWEIWCAAVGDNPAAPPGEWRARNRIYGSETHVIESPECFAISRAKSKTEFDSIYAAA